MFLNAKCTSLNEKGTRQEGPILRFERKVYLFFMKKAPPFMRKPISLRGNLFIVYQDTY